MKHILLLLLLTSMYNNILLSEVKPNPALSTNAVKNIDILLGNNKPKVKSSNWLTDIISFFTPEPIHGLYEEDDMRSDGRGPWFFFDRHNKHGTSDDIAELRLQMDTLRNWILNNKYNYRDIYIKIYEEAQGSLSNCNGEKSVCASAKMAKLKAFVYVIGLRKVDLLTVTTFTTTGDRNAYKDDVVNYLKHIDDPDLYDSYDNWSFVPGVNLTAAIAMWEKIFWRSKELQLIVEAFDLLRGAHNLDYTLEYNNIDINDMAARIIERYVVPLYRRAKAGTFAVADNNYSLIAGSALASAAIVFHDYGAYIWNWQKRPDRWANASYYFIHDVMWSIDKRMSEQGDFYGYQEGPHYFKSAFVNMIPMFRARKNFSASNKYVKYSKATFLTTHHWVKNFMFDENYNRLYARYNNILTPNGDPPAFDDSYHQTYFNGMFAIIGNQNNGIENCFNFERNIDKLGIEGVLGLRVDYLAALTPPKDIILPEEIKMPSGNVVFRGKDDLGSDHYLHILVERGIADGSSHEHKEYGHFDIHTDDCTLLFDPPFYGDYSNYYIGETTDHNVATVDGIIGSEGIFESNIIGDSLNNFVVKSFTCGNNQWTREFQVFKNQNINDTSKYYYIITDHFKNIDSTSKDFELRFNGNGNQSLFPGDSVTYIRNSKFAEWSYSADSSRGLWGVQVGVSCSDSNYNLSETNYERHGCKDSKFLNIVLNNSYGTHARLIAKSTSSIPVTFTTVIAPKKRNTKGLLGKTNITTTNSINRVLINLGSENSLFNLHIGKRSNLYDTLSSPLDFDTGFSLITNAINTFLSWDTVPALAHKGCVTTANFRACGVTNGSFLSYNGDNFISSLNATYFTTYYKLVNKNRYEGTISTENSATVSYYIPDATLNYSMKAVSKSGKSLSYVYDSINFIMTINFNDGLTYFSIEPKDPCLADCFFPPTADSIKNTFHFYEGTYEYLAHDLDIVADTGQLLLSHGSRMHICQNYTLVNNDSIVLKPYIGFNKSIGEPFHTSMPGAEGLSPNNVHYPGDAFNGLPNEKRTSIIVDDKAALVLDSGSYTHIGVNCLLWIKKGGTLFVKKGALLEVGNCGFEDYGAVCGGANAGTVIIDDSAFICVEDSAELRFFKIIGDTVDRNIFFISTRDGKPALAGVNTKGASGKFEASDWNGNPGRFSAHNCIELCSLYIVNPPDVVHNEPWGWCNYNFPKSSFKVRSPYCVNDTVFMEDVYKSLNETRAIIEIFQHDTLFPIKTGYAEKSRLFENVKINFFAFDSPDVYYIRLITINSCGVIDTLTRSLVVIGNPTPTFTMSDHAICPGKDNVYTLFNPGPFTSYNWHVHAIDTSINPYVATITERPQYGGDWIGDSLISDTFRFDNFYFYGGLKYAVALTTKTNCGTHTIWDTLEVQPGAYIQLSRPTVYAQPINGATSVQLNGYISIADSFRWEPTTWLNRTDTNVVISTPEDAINYVLIAKYGECTSTDTTFIKYNRVANAGVNDTLCFTNDTALLGNSYDMSIFLGFLYYKGGSNFYNLFSTKTSTDPAYFRYLTHFLMHKEMVEQWLQCGTPIMDKFRDQIYRRQILKQPWFKEYYTQLTRFTDPDMGAFDLFVNGINSNYELAANMDAQGDWGEFNDCMVAVFSYYDQFVSNQLSEVSSTWTKIVNEDTTTMTAWDEYFVITDKPLQTTTYIQSVITPEYAEIDEVTIYRDTVLVPIFVPVLQWDSTVYFGNYTQPFSDATTFSWNFGDGSALSSDVNPIHTFPTFNDSFIVCLTATNKCGNYTYCDTIYIDSARLTSGSMVFVPSDVKTEINNSNKQQLNAKVSLPNIGGTSLINYPNPFDGSTIINYQILKAYTHAELRVTNVLGQEVYNQKLTKPIDNITINGYNLQNGLYYYSLIIDGRAEQTKIMSVMH